MANILKQFRELMTLRNLNLYVLPRTDEHQSEYICNCDERIKFISGFSGSNAIALISQTEAFLWTDGRYFLQAEKELHEGWVMKKLIESEKKWFEHVAQNYPKESRIGIDSRLMTAQGGTIRSKFLAEKEFTVEFSASNLVDEIWTNRPPSSAAEIYLHEQWAGKTMTQKVNWVRDNIKKKEGKAAIFNDLSEIAWILNLRSSEIPHNPFFKSVLSVGLEGGVLYLPVGHVSLKSQEVIEHLGAEKIEVMEYPPKFQEKSLIVKSSLNYHIFSSLINPIDWDGIGIYRAVRTQKQLNGFKRCHVVDGVAMAKFWAWRSKKDEVDEYEAALYINNLRYQQELNKGLSFDTISGGGPNAAVIHYHPTESNHSLITKDMIHLLDSGGQYLDGTTDVTRTFHFGKATPEEKDAFTRVLLGNLDIERLKWPKHAEIDGKDIDVLARRHLWAKGLDYLHGTGHGVGHFLGVHEGPVGISCRNRNVFKPGMIVTNEPGYYEPGKYGIRIENILIVRQTDGINWFENITLCPYDKNLMALELLKEEDRQHINKYHEQIWNTVSPLLKDDEESLIWLKQATSPLS